MERDIVLSLRDICKEYPGVQALDHVSIDFRAGEVHALLGENGAGKSTLIKTIAGAITPTSGSICLPDGKEVKAMTPALAKKYGIEVVYQEFNLIGCLSVAENICFGERHGKFVNYKAMREKARKVFDMFKVDIDPSAPVYQLPSSKQQIVEIAKAISRKAKILIMDEPSAPLSVVDVERMFTVVRELKAAGVCIIYISHRMEELFEISDRVSILRDGQSITTLETAKTTRQELVNHMVGRELKETFPSHAPCSQEVALRVRNLTGNGDVDISFDLHKGEILGLAGLVGAGRTELVRMICGADKAESGTIEVFGKPVKLHMPSQAIAHGIGMIPEDRKNQGCLLNRDIKTNITLSCVRSISHAGVIDRKREKGIVKQYIDELRIATPSAAQLVGNLSGGNQQKVVVAKTLAANCNIIIFDEPTRGIDVGAKQEIYKLLASQAEKGVAILMITSEMEELLGISDRIIVIHEGRVAGELQKGEFSQARVLELASGE